MKFVLALLFGLVPAYLLIEVKGEDLVVPERPGGIIINHIVQAEYWDRLNYRLILAEDQWSAAAMQVLYYHLNKGDVCAMPGIMLHFHQPFRLDELGVRVGVPYKAMFQILFGAIITEKIGDLDTTSWKSFAPAEFGIRTCD